MLTYYIIAYNMIILCLNTKSMMSRMLVQLILLNFSSLTSSKNISIQLDISA